MRPYIYSAIYQTAGIISWASCIFLFTSFHIVFGIFNADELKVMNYEVDILSSPIQANKEIDLPVLHMTSKFGQQYQCTLPQLIPANEESISGSKESSSTEIPEIQDLLKPLHNGPCLIKPRDWWTYELCVGQNIRQYHMEDSQIMGSALNLGIYDSDYDWSSQGDKSGFLKLKQPRYHSQYYVNGSNCDLTGKPRTTEVRFYCEVNAGDYISRVDEPETCRYIITVHTDRVCSHPYLKPAPSAKPHTIQCNPVLQEEHYAKYMQKVQEEQEMAEKKRQEWIEQQQKQLEEHKLRLLQEKESQEKEQDSKGSDGYVKVESEDEDEEIQEQDPSEDPDDISDEEFGDLLKELSGIPDFIKGFDKRDMNEEVLNDVTYNMLMLLNTLNGLFNELAKTQKDLSEAGESYKKIDTVLEKLQGTVKEEIEGMSEEQKQKYLKDRFGLLDIIAKELEKLEEVNDDSLEGTKDGRKKSAYTILASTLSSHIRKLEKAEKEVTQAINHFKIVIQKLDSLEGFSKNFVAEKKNQFASVNKDLIKELQLEDELEEESDKPFSSGYDKLRSVLNSVVKKLDDGKTSFSMSRSNFQMIQQHLVKLQEEKEKLQKNEDRVEADEPEDEEDETEQNESKLMPDFDNKVQIRISKVGAQGKLEDAKLPSLKQKDLDKAQTQKLEEAVREKLEKAGFDANGHRIEVRIITTGYYDDEDGKAFRVLTDDEAQQFQNMILTLLTGGQEARKELERQRQMEKNYQFVWGEGKPVSEETEES